MASDVVEVGPEDESPGAEPEGLSPIFVSLQRALEDARGRLLDMSLRNKLISTNVTANRARQVRITDRASDDLFRRLRAGKSLSFLATIPRGQQSDGDDKRESITAGDVQVSVDAQEASQRENQLPVRMTPEGLTKRLTTMFYEGRTLEEEQGVSVLFLALGFLEWREAPYSEKERFAPLLLQPVELERAGARDRYKLKIRQDDLYTNVSLQAWLDKQFGLELPELPEGDDWVPSDYFADVEASIGGRPGWAVRRDEIVLGFFSFSKFLMWRDLDPENWPDASMLADDDLLKRILLRSDEETHDAPLIRDDERLDDVFKPVDLVHVTDADSSQAIAIQDALEGRDLVIQGPPGTGKSQTITNIIAGAVKRGKRVLFVAEKMAALEVVHQRLVDRKLGAMCLELHSRKSSKAQVIAQIKQAKAAPSRPNWPPGAFKALEEAQAHLRRHSDLMHERQDGLSAFDLIGRMSLIKTRNVPAPSFMLIDAANWKLERLESEAYRAAQLGERLTEAGDIREHPWRGVGIPTPDQLEQERLKPFVESAARAAAALTFAAKAARKALEPTSDDTAKNLATWVEALAHLADRPVRADPLLANDTLMPLIDVLSLAVANGERLVAIRARLANKVRQETWGRDWPAVRMAVAGQGHSLFRMFSQRYRDAVADLRGAWIGDLPKSHEARLKMLDDLIDGQGLAKLIAEAGTTVGTAAGGFWQGEETDWALFRAVLDWLVGSQRFEPSIQLRRPERLISVNDARELAEGLRTRSEELHDALDDLFKAVELDLRQALDNRSVDDLTTRELAKLSARWRDRFAEITQWPPIREGFAWLDRIGCEQMAREIYAGQLGGHQVEDVLRLAVYEAKWRKLRKEHPEIPDINGDDLSKLVGNFRKADIDRISKAADEVGRAHADGRPAGSAGAVGILDDEMRKSRNLKPVRRLMELAGGAVQAFKPVFLMSPLSIAQYLPPGALKFDMLVIDEASQVRPEDAIGAIARCDQVVVVGDNMQLPPTNFFNKMINDTEDTDDEDDELPDGAPRRAALKDIESILDLCSRFPERMLRWHYRSEHPGLIAISNRRFYRNQLLLPPSVIAGVTDGSTGLIFHKIAEGGYDRGKTRRNEIEAEAVAKAALKHAHEYPDLSLGVGAFSMAQRDAIRDRLDRLCALHPELDEFVKGKAVNGGERREPVFVKNLENIQGDERDVIFISVGYGKDADGRFVKSFGPVGAVGGERRLNVLITRARKRCEVFSSIVAEDITFDGPPKPGVAALKEFLKLAKDGHIDVAEPTARDFDSDFEEAVAHEITTLGYEVLPQIGTAGFFVDIGVIDPGNPQRFVLGVECDGAAYHSSRYARDRDRLRQMILEKRGWKIHRIWSTDWFYRREREIAKLKDAIEAALAGRAIPSATNIYDFEPFIPNHLLPSNVDGPVGVASTVTSDTDEDDEAGVAPARRSALRPYEFAEFRVHKNEPHALYDGQLADIVSRIVEIEQPIHEEEVGRRLAHVCGLQRAGNRIQAAAKRGLDRARRDRKLAVDRQFWTQDTRADAEPRSRAQLAPAEMVRKPGLVSGRELAAAAVVALSQSLAMYYDELVTETARLIGWDRVGDDVATAIGDAIETHLADRIEEDHLGRLKLK